MQLPIYQADAFASQLFGGNPAALPYQGVICTARGDGFDCDFVSRFFPRDRYRRGPRHRLRAYTAYTLLGGKAGQDAIHCAANFPARR